MKNLTFIISLCAITSSGTLFPMKRSADSLKPLSNEKDFYVYTCTYQGRNESFAMKSSLDEHMHASHDLKHKTTLRIRNPKYINHIKDTPIIQYEPKEHTNLASLITKINDAATTHYMNQEINIDDISQTEESSSETEEEIIAEISEEDAMRNNTIGSSHTNPLLAIVITQSAANTLLKKFPCTFEGCTKAFTTTSNLKTHMRTHTEEKPYTCTFVGCNKAFTDNANLIHHAKTHTGEKPYPCTFVGCDKSFARSSSLIRHIRTHTGERPYMCENCDKSFIQNSDLTKHMRIHTEEKPYICKVCNKAFTEKSDLTRHVRIHTGEKPYSCTHCNKSFAIKSNLNAHMQTHI